MNKEGIWVRQSIRLKKYNYSRSGLYFVTICTQNRECLFGYIVNGVMRLNEIGKIVKNIWESLPKHHPVELDAFQIMPNHVHFVLIISCRRGIARNAPTFGNVIAGSLSCVVRSFKSECTKQINIVYATHESNIRVWQRNYYEHIVRTKTDLNKIREYIKMNPQMWETDRNMI